MTDLLTPFDLGDLRLPNRIVMSRMTRTRATEDDMPTELMRDYYVQRATAGLIVTECTPVSDQARGIIRAPGMHRADQVAGWRVVTDAVHAAGERIYDQLWHPGRVGHPDMRGGEAVVAPSPLPATGNFYLNTGFDRAKGDAVLASRNADLLAFGVPFIANPDLVERLRTGEPMNEPDPKASYGVGLEGYTDYPTLAA